MKKKNWERVFWFGLGTFLGGWVLGLVGGVFGGAVGGLKRG